jgi:hypothetical protein
MKNLKVSFFKSLQSFQKVRQRVLKKEGIGGIGGNMTDVRSSCIGAPLLYKLYGRGLFSEPTRTSIIGVAYSVFREGGQGMGISLKLYNKRRQERASFYFNVLCFSIIRSIISTLRLENPYRLGSHTKLELLFFLKLRGGI